jgi:hypothetical protein
MYSRCPQCGEAAVPWYRKGWLDGYSAVGFFWMPRSPVACGECGGYSRVPEDYARSVEWRSWIAAIALVSLVVNLRLGNLWLLGGVLVILAWRNWRWHKAPLLPMQANQVKRPEPLGVLAGFMVLAVLAAFLNGYFWVGIALLVLALIIYMNKMNK